MDLVEIPPGWFWMGWEDGHPGERPVHEVWVDAFGIATTPVTNDEYAAYLRATAAPPPVRVRSSDQDTLAGLLSSPGVTVAPAGDGALAVSGLPAAQIGAVAAAAGITVLELATEQASLEDAFVDLTQDAVEFPGIESEILVCVCRRTGCRPCWPARRSRSWCAGTGRRRWPATCDASARGSWSRR